MSGASFALPALERPLSAVQSDHSTAFSDVSAASDPSSLRAAALMTLKAKRRKHTNNQPSINYFGHRPPPPSDSMVQLDYGQDDTTTPLSPRLTAAPPPAPPPLTPPVEMEDGQIREEGEISEEEIPPPVPAITEVLQLAQTPAKPPSSPKPQVFNITSPSSRRPFLKLESPPPSILQHIQPPSDPHTRPVNTESLSVYPIENDLQRIRQFLSQIDADHIRPGLAMNQDQYDKSKDILLDLLGWGVPPEYLVDCGLSPLFLFYTFNELNLRFPRNLDVSRFTPYPPIPDMLDHPELYTTPLPKRHLPHSSQSHQQQGSRPSHSAFGSDDDIGATPQFTTPSPISPSPLVHPPQESQPRSLDDIERERKRELLARKAVQDSRKVKQTITSSETPISATSAEAPSTDSGRSSLVPFDNVDDFLNTITTPGPILSVTTDVANIEERESSMDIDQTPLSDTLPVSTNATAFFEPPSPVSVSPATSSLTQEPALITPIATSGTYTSEELTLQSPLTPASRNFPRRGVKRPVASDFVDFEVPETTRKESNRSGPSKIFNNFAPINTMRRCVIDLSDDEDDDELPDPSPAPPKFSELERDKRPIRLRGGPPSVRPASAMSSASYQSTSSITPNGAQNGALTPAALAQKELEIQRMRALIAEKERNNQLKKLAAAKFAPSNSSGSSSGESTPVLITKTKGNEDQQAQTSLQSSGPTLTGQAPQVPTGTVFKPPPQATVTDQKPSGTSYHKHTLSPSQSTGHALWEASETATETRHEQVDSNSTIDDAQSEAMQVDEQVDVDQLTSASTQTANPPAFARQEEYSEHANPINATIPAKKFDYEAYSSLFAWYPMLRSVSGNPSTSASSSPASTSSRSLTSHPISDTRDIPSIDFDTLRLRSVLTYLDPSKQLCRYEVPGGGECRDDQCEDVHLSKLGQGGGVVPSDHVTASYVLESLPSPWLKEHGITCARIVQAVEQVRNKNPAMGFEDCVIHALYSIGQPPPT